MKFLLNCLSLVLVCVFSFNAAYATVIEESPNILQIDFYPNGAKFTFESKTDEKGNFEVILPSSFSHITDWRMVPISRPGWIPPSLSELNSEIESNKNKMNLLNAKIGSLNQTLRLLGEMRNRGDDFNNFINYIREAQSIHESAAVEIFNLHAEREKIEVRFNALTEEFRSKLPDNHDRAIKVSGRSDANSTVRIEAFTNAARWAPVHKLNLDTQTGKIAAKLYAHVVQRTGIDAAEIPVRFHTNNPQRSDVVPQLPPLIVDIRQRAVPVPLQRSRAALQDEALIMAPMFEMAMDAPRIESGLISVTIDSEGSIKGGGVTEEIYLGSYSINSQISLISIPEYGSAVYLVAETEPLEQIIVEGNAKLYVDGNISSNIYLRRFVEGERAELTFGIAPLVTAEKRNIIPKTDTSWWGTSGYLNNGYTIEITNGMATEQTIIVKDRIPVSANTRISVRNIRYAPEPSEKTEDNILTWNINVKPGETFKISVNYTLEFPASESLMFR